MRANVPFGPKKIRRDRPTDPNGPVVARLVLPLACIDIAPLLSPYSSRRAQQRVVTVPGSMTGCPVSRERSVKEVGVYYYQEEVASYDDRPKTETDD